MCKKLRHPNRVKVLDAYYKAYRLMLQTLPKQEKSHDYHNTEKKLGQ